MGNLSHRSESSLLPPLDVRKRMTLVYESDPVPRMDCPLTMDDIAV